MISRIVMSVVIAVALAALVQSLPDVKRYLEPARCSRGPEK